MLAEQVARTTRVPLNDIARVDINAYPGGLHPRVTVTFARHGQPPSIAFHLRYRPSKAREVHAILSSVLSSCVASA